LKINCFNNRNTILAVILIVLPLPYLFAQVSKDTTNSLSPVSVYYNRWERKINEVPNRITKFNLKQQRLQNPQTMADAIGVTGEVFIQKSQMGGGSPMIRGFATNRVLMVVDGVRMNNAIYRSGNLQNIISFDPLALEDAEVIFGPGSLMYGSDAIGGVMDFHTLQPKFATENKTLVKGDAFVRYASANQEKTGHANVNIAGNKFSLLTSFTASDFGDLQMGKNGGQESYLRKEYVERIGNQDVIVKNVNPLVQKKSGYHQNNLLTKLRYKPSEHWDIQYGFHYSKTGNIPRYDRLIEYASGNLRFAEWNYGPQFWTMQNMQIQHKKTTTLYNEAKLVVAYQQYEESRIDRRRNNNNQRTQTENVDATSINVDFTKAMNEAQEIFYGAEWVGNVVGSKATNVNITNNLQTNVATRYPNGATCNSFAIYTSYKKVINQKLNYSGGLRFNTGQTKASFDTTFFKFPFTSSKLKNSNVTGNLGLVFKPTERLQLNVLASTGFRMPNIDDIGKVFESAPGNVVVPNNQLKPEYAWNYEIGVQYNKPEKINYYLSVFTTTLNNALTNRPFSFNGQDSIVYDGIKSRVNAIQNVANAKVWGVQLGWELFLNKHIKWQTKLNWIEGHETDDVKNEQVPLRHAPPLFGSSAVQWQKGQFALEINTQFNGQINNANLAPSEKAKTAIYALDKSGKQFCPGWYALHAKASYAIDKLQIHLGWENITNQQYRPYSSGIVAAGTNFITSLRYSF
jgi:hemoglobin/transferrin/lactoferrin receptor protein